LTPQTDYQGNLLRPWMIYIGKFRPHYFMRQNGPVRTPHYFTERSGMDATVSHTAIHCLQYSVPSW